MKDFDIYDKVLVRDENNEVWKPDIIIFERDENTNLARYVTIMGDWKQCIPYEGNESIAWTDKHMKRKYKQKEQYGFKTGEVAIISSKTDRIEGVVLEVNKETNICTYATKVGEYWHIGEVNTKNLRKKINI